MLHYYIWTIGCQMNKVESERLSSYLEHIDYQPASIIEEADLIFLNSCVVRQSAENKVINKLHSLQALKKSRPNTRIALTGCIVDGDSGALKEQFPHIDYFFPAGDFPSWLGKREPDQLLPLQPSISSFVPIMQGCNNFCSYCIVPYRRGRERSRPPDEIVCEVRTLVARGTREVTLLGQNVDSYGHDLAGQSDLADLLQLLNPISGLSRIRFLTNHPKDMKDRLLDAMAAQDKVCWQINLPVQAGNDEILEAMRRGYTRADYLALIARIRSKLPGVALSTDVIVGFPGESEAQFQDTIDLIRSTGFDLVHVAAYSPRAGTLAASQMEDNVPAGVKKDRLDRIEQLQAEIAAGINSRFDQTIVEILVEGQEKGKWFGRTRSDKLVFFSSAEDCLGRLVEVQITRAGPWSLSGQKV